MSALPSRETVLFVFGPFLLDRERRLLARDGEAVSITPKAFDLLAILVARAGTVVTKDELMMALWPDTAVEESNLTFQISTLRKVLGPEGARAIATLPGRGYQFVAPIRRLDDDADGAEVVLEQRERTTVVVTERSRDWKRLGAMALAIAVLATVAAAIFTTTRPASSSPIKSLAVLPFKPLAATQRDEAMELGMADTLITRLAGIPDLTVRPISAVRRFSGLEDDPMTAAGQLGVDAVLDGSIQRRGSRMRVTMRLIHYPDGKPVWSRQFDDDARDLFAMQDRVAELVARAMIPALSPATHARLARRPTGDLQAYELFLKGRYLSDSDPDRAEEYFRAAIARDENFAAAWAGVADTWLLRTRFGSVAPRANVDKAREAAVRAVTLDPALADAHAALAQVYSDHDWDWDRAEAEYRRALELNPSSDIAHGQYAYLLLFIRRDFDGALEHVGRAMEIDPLSPVWVTEKVTALDLSGHHQEAIRAAEDALRTHPDFIPMLLHLGMAYGNAGQPEKAVEVLQRAIDLAPGSLQLSSMQAWAYAEAGNREKALEIIRAIEASGGNQPSHNLAMAWTALGDYDRAFAALERAYKERIFLLRVITVAPGYAPLRKDPRYADLMRRMRVP